MIKRCHTVAELNLLLGERKGTVGLVPTMGALHEGHLSLVRQALEACDQVVVSIFVNPTQFAPHEDFDSYPRTVESDMAMLAGLGDVIVFTPSRDEVYGEGDLPVDSYERPTFTLLCGGRRPHFFGGVCRVVYRLFKMVGPDKAYFGEKDYQQLQIIRQMCRDFDLDVDVVGCSLIRESDGLAMSSRNQYMTDQERATSIQIYAGLRAVREAFSNGDQSVASLRRCFQSKLTDPQWDLDYCEIVGPQTLNSRNSEAILGDRLIVAAVLGKTRLIDNCSI
ncbi:pantoate--beta-alanine ligase [bacterium]|jgi:pantoate--beta-alanine ligase|nr:pantoate--beta-alanine ligase [bacterium]